ncbi:calcium-binding protein [Paracoccus fistulariae]|uniref:Triacylglycerol lipase n=1 Tax=Paracoccus fistulariae TaxID=658446 RepID=A0ABY7SL93_9RHOB|nr:hypothetical protein [Paracoccus fistulariae]MDB6181961.1 hypothetical protein [Paracoccus fistulariae]WCR06802.1 hypothetical protein JHX87_15195 [Paracoccus fistulariae]
MSVFDYKDLSGAEAAELVALTHRLAGVSQMNGMPQMGALMQGGVLSGGAVATGLPEGWRNVGAAELGLDPSVVDAQGFIKLTSPLTGNLPGGPQLMIFAEENPDGSIARLAVSYAGTNNLADVIDYTQLNSGEMSAAMEPVLSALRSFAEGQGLTGEDVIVTGYSLGGGYTNIQARFADQLAGGFFADSLYVGHDGPVIHDDPGRVLNVGYENDVIFRATGTAEDFWDAIGQADPLLSNNDNSYQTTTDNLVIFDGAYAGAEVTLQIDSILNLMSWWGHVGGVFSDALQRVGNSAFYEFTSQDSAIVVSNLGADLRGLVWVRDKAAPTSDHHGAPGFIVGTAYDDRLADGLKGDWLDGGAGDDLIRVEHGLNRVDGGQGEDILQIVTRVADLQVYRLADGTMVFDSGKSLTLASDIEAVQIKHPGLLGGTTDYSIKGDRLEDEHWSFFELGDRDIAYGQAVSGLGSDEVLSGRVVFGQAGDDRITGTSGADLLHGGEGGDQLSGGRGNDRLFGAEGDDQLSAGAGLDRLAGGQGDDVFIFDAAVSGRAIVEDFNLMSGDQDQLMFRGGDGQAALAAAQQQGSDVVIEFGRMVIVLEEVQLADLENSLLL